MISRLPFILRHLHYNRWMISAILCILLCTITTSARAAIPEEQKSRVLILNSYHLNYIWSDNEIEGLLETLAKGKIAIEPIVEYLDCKFFPNMEHFPLVARLFQYKFKNIRIPLVIAVDNPSLDFALRYRAELFPNAPIVFCGINGFEQRMIEGERNITGSAERLDTRNTVELMLKLHPGTKEIFVIHDYTSTGKATRREAENDLKEMDSHVRIRFMDDLTTDGMLAEVRKLPADALVLSLSYSRDREGRVFDHTRISQLLGENSPVPVYGTHEERLGYGIVGGSLLGGKHHAIRAANTALEILDGKTADAIPVNTGTTSRFMFDYSQLQRFKIALSNLPENSIIINRPESFYRKYTTLVWTVIGIFSSLAAIITLLMANISQKRRSGEELARKAAELEHSNSELREFTFLAYHDLQEPLRNISGFVQLIQKRYQGRLDSDADEYINLVVHNVTHLKQLFNDFLHYHQLGKSPLRQQNINMSDMIGSVISSLYASIDECHATVKLEAMPDVSADPVMIQQLFRHLIDNSLKFGGDTPEITIIGRLDGNRVLYSLSDNGVGIPKEHQEKVFQIFRKLQGQSQNAGTGIGLSICKRIVMLHGGKIWIKSEKGMGTTFNFSLPTTDN